MPLPKAFDVVGSSELRQAATSEQDAALYGYALDVSQYPFEERSGLKLAKDGRTVLIPPPSDSPDDPLNWSHTRKILTLAIITLLTGLPDFASAMGVVTLIPQGAIWGVSPDSLEHSQAANVFCTGFGGILALTLSSYFGNLPILLLFHCVALATGAWCASATTFQSYFAARVLNGLFSAVAQSTALTWIRAMFFFHEHARKINIWAFAPIMAPYLGPQIAAFVCAKLSWRWCFWLYTILNAIAWLCIVLFLDEPQYNRNVLTDPANPAYGNRLSRLVGLEQWKRRHFDRRSLGESIAAPFFALTKVAILMVIAYYFLVVSWVVGLNAVISVWLTSYYSFGFDALGYFYFFSYVGVAIGLLLGHWLHDAFSKSYAKRHHGLVQAEARLIIVYPATIMMAISLLVLGFSLRSTWHYMVLAVFATLQIIGFLINTAAINAYLLDAYPEWSGEVCAWIVIARTTGGAMSVYVQLPWVARDGPLATLGTQAAITVASLLFIVLLQLFGPRLRRKQSHLSGQT